MKTLRRILSTAPVNKDAGLLVIRLGVGLSMLAFHGWGKITGGPGLWEGVGGSMSNVGINFGPVFWGFMAALSESVCSALIVLGVLFRPAAALLTFTMLIAAINHMNLPAENPRSGLGGASHALEFMFVYLGLLLTGAGRFVLPLPGTRTPE